MKWVQDKTVPVNCPGENGPKCKPGQKGPERFLDNFGTPL